MAWMYVFFAGLLEIGWVFGLKWANDVWGYLLVALIILISFYNLMQSYKTLPVGVVYAVFTGIGTVGIVIIESIFLGGTVTVSKLFFIFLITAGVVGLKLTVKGE